jgi:L-iditol 2-dehydrogenase
MTSRLSLNPIGTPPARLKSVTMKPKGGAEVSEVSVPEIRQDELLVRMTACGLCGTDLEKMRGEYTASMPVLGHEAVGVVAEVGGGGLGFKKGDRVFPHHHVSCGQCVYCVAGNPTMCDKYRSTNLDPGGFSELFRVPGYNIARSGVLRLPPSIDDELGTLIEPLACCIRAVERTNVRPGMAVQVVGAGPVGLLHSLYLKSMGAEPIVSDISPERVRQAGKFGITAFDGGSVDVTAEVRRMTGGRGADAAIVASGSPKALVQGLKSVRKGGSVCLFGIPPRWSKLEFDLSDVYNAELSLVTSYGGTETDTGKALDLLAHEGGPFKDLITHRFTLERFADAVEVAESGKGMKVILTP